jgi:ribosomal protein S18 acetylase RimI-like enzyme
MTAEWHMQRAGTPNANEPMPALYQEFVGHDNNRDGYMLNMIESRVMEHTWRQWEPNIIYVHHQSAPFPTRIWLPPFAEPIALHTPYIVSRELNMIGMAIARRLESEGKVGATHMGSGYDAWYPGYVDYAPAFKNIPAFWTETQGRGPAPQETRRDQIASDMQRPQSLYSSPWLGGRWTLRDQVEYMKTASMATIEYAAKYKDSLLYDRYLAGKAQIARGRTEAPYAYVVPQTQRDPVAAVEMLRRLAFAGVRVYRLTSDATIEGERFPEGTWVVPADQEFAALAREVLDVQAYPEIRESPEGPLDQPYDAAGWTLPLSMGVRTVYAQAPLGEDVRRQMKIVAEPAGDKVRPSPYGTAKDADAQPFDTAPGIGFDSEPMAKAIVPPAGRVTGSGPALAVNPAENNAFKAINRAWKAGATVRFDRGRYVISGLEPVVQTQLVEALALNAERVAEPTGPSGRPRIGLFLANTSMDEGWTRWVLEQYEFAVTRVSGADIQAGSLRDKIDVLLVTDEPQGVLQGGGGRGGRGGGGGGGGDQAAANDARVAAIEAFVGGGGTLVCFNRSSAFAISRLKLPVKDVTAGLTRETFFAGTSLLNVTVDATQRVMSGMPERAAVFFSGSPAFETLDGFNGTVLARYPEDHVLASGFLLGQSVLAGKAAALDVPRGTGHVVLLGFRPQWRGQPFGTFRVIFNALLTGARLP